MSQYRFTDPAWAGVYRAIAERRDMRHFVSDPLAPELLSRLLQAAHQAGSVGLSNHGDLFELPLPICARALFSWSSRNASVPLRPCKSGETNSCN